MTQAKPEHRPEKDARLDRPWWQRWLLLGAGIVCLGLGILGIFVPLLPTTPLILVAAFCFARGSSRAHAWLLRHRALGPIVREWEENRTIPPRAKWTGVILVVIAFAISFIFVPNCGYGYATLSVLAVVLIVSLLRLPSQRPASENNWADPAGS